MTPNICLVEPLLVIMPHHVLVFSCASQIYAVLKDHPTPGPAAWRSITKLLVDEIERRAPSGLEWSIVSDATLNTPQTAEDGRLVFQILFKRTSRGTLAHGWGNKVSVERYGRDELVVEFY